MWTFLEVFIFENKLYVFSAMTIDQSYVLLSFAD